MPTSETSNAELAISIVSHGHGELIGRLLDELAGFERATPGFLNRVILTLNVPECVSLPSVEGWPFELVVIRNEKPAGFGRNHNCALRGVSQPFVCVLNPDVVFENGNPFIALMLSAARPGVGCAYPVQLDARGLREDSEREVPTPFALWRRRFLGRVETRVDWVNAACMVLPTKVWESIGGFDERYFMYCEDVDLCLRMRREGWALARAQAVVVHSGQRASNRHWRHLGWHIASLMRLWRSPAYRWAVKSLPQLDRRECNMDDS